MIDATKRAMGKKHTKNDSAGSADRSKRPFDPTGGSFGLGDAKTRLAALALFVLSIALYANTFGHRFVWDDRELIVENPAIQSLDSATIHRAFGGDYWRVSRRGRGYYRPLTTLSFHLDYRLFGDNASGYHAVNVLLNAIVSMLAFLFLRAVAANTPAALVGAVIFAAHPVHTESVAWISGRTDILATFWSLVSLLCYTAYRRRAGAAWLSGTSGAFVLALLSKESAACLPLIALLLEFGPFGLAPGPRRWRLSWNTIARTSPMFALLGLYLLLRRDTVGAITSNYHAYAPGVLGKVALPLSILAGYAGKLVWPFRLSGEYDALVPQSFTETAVVVGAVLVGGAIALSIRYRHRADVVLAVGLTSIALLPVLNIVPIGEVSAERYLYFPALGFCFGLGILVGPAVAKTWPRVFGYALSARRPVSSPITAGAVLFATLTLAFAVRTVSRNPDWRDETTLFAKTAETTPNSARAHLNVGNAARREGREPDAIRAYRRALEIDPESPDALSNLAGVLVHKGRLDEARRLVERALRSAPDNVQILNNLGALYFQENRTAQAVELFERARAIDPSRPDTHFNLGLAALRTGRDDEASDHFLIAAGGGPRFVMAHYYVADIADRAGNVALARRHAKQFLAAYPRTDAYRRHASEIAMSR